MTKQARDMQQHCDNYIGIKPSGETAILNDLLFFNVNDVSSEGLENRKIKWYDLIQTVAQGKKTEH